MDSTNVAATRGIVQEALTRDNYERWKTLMKNYLLGKNLWSVVESGSVPTDQRRVREERERERKRKRKRKEAEALHIIQLSCGSKILDEISHFETPRDAWNHLSVRYGSELRAEADIEQGVVEDNLFDYKDLYGYVEKGDWKNAESFIKDRRGAIFSVSASRGRTVLHVATMAGHVKIIEALVETGKDALLKMQDQEGYTALALAAHLTGNADVAKCLVEKERGEVRVELLAIANEDGEIPLLLAAAKGHKQMTRYLYAKTETSTNGNLLNGLDFRKRVLLFERCIKAEIFDVARELLVSYPELPIESLSDGFGALHSLAQMPSAFLSSCHYGRRRQFVYYILKVEKKFQDSGVHTTNFSGMSGRQVFFFFAV